MAFRDRRDAGRRLASVLAPLHGVQPLVVALPRGGVPVAAEIAQDLDAPLDVALVRKVGAPMQRELAIGAVSEDGIVVIDEHLVARLGIGRAELRNLVERAQREIGEQATELRPGRASVRVKGRTVVVVDDGLATGSTMRAALAALRRRGAARVVVAVPVGAPDTCDALRDEADDVVCLASPPQFSSVGQWYEDFSPVSDDEVRHLLAAADRRCSEHTTGETIAVPSTYDVTLDLRDARVPGRLAVAPGCSGAVVFAHGSGSSHRSVRNRRVATALEQAGLSTLLFDLLTPEESADRRNVFDIPLLGRRLLDATAWLVQQAGFADVAVGWFGASTGAGAALWAAPDAGGRVRAIVSRGGRPDLARERLVDVNVPTLLVVGGADVDVLELNRDAQHALHGAETRLEIVAGATHLFEEPGAMEQVTDLARDWFLAHLSATPASASVL
ncbi:MAG TPA: phosphoribosyltransferase family protein [Acidimicrobiia bacterium]|nr:phosphoribosyltransferase family protein [Acidimicrobiia bacterium]